MINRCYCMRCALSVQKYNSCVPFVWCLWSLDFVIYKRKFRFEFSIEFRIFVILLFFPTYIVSLGILEDKCFRIWNRKIPRKAYKIINLKLHYTVRKIAPAQLFVLLQIKLTIRVIYLQMYLISIFRRFDFQ